MPNRLLTKEEVEKIVSQAKAKKTLHPRPFLTENVVEIAEAVRDNKRTVVLQDRTFLITHTPFYGGSVLVEPASHKFVPCGYFPLRTLKHALEDQDVD